MLDLGEMRRLADEWDALALSAAAPNPYFSRRVIAAHVAGGILDEGALRFVVLRHGTELVGLLPFLTGAGRCGWKRIDSACTSLFMMLSTPLIARSPGDEAAAADWADRLLDAIADHGRGGPFMLPRLSLSCPLGSQIVKAVRRRDWACRVFDGFERPVADLAGSYEAYARAFIGRNRRKSIRRLRNRLQEVGELRHEVATHGAALAAAVESFLALEASGWKGRKGTALASRPETLRMLRAMVADASEDSPIGSGASGVASMRADLLLLDERPIAASVGFVSGGVAYMWKIADDETMRNSGPGIVLEDAILRQAHLDESLRQLDSAAGPGSALETMYGGRTLIGDLVFVPSGRGGGALLAAEAIRRRLRAVLKSIRDRLIPGRRRSNAPASQLWRLVGYRSRRSKA